MYMDDIILFAKNKNLEFGIEKCAILIMKSGKRQMTEEITLEEKENYEHLGILDADIIKLAEMKGI